MPRSINVRAAAAIALHRVVFAGRSLDAVLPDARFNDERDRALLQELAIGSVRHYYSLSEVVGRFLVFPLKPRDTIVHCLLVVGAYQLRHTRIPHYAAVSDTVNATRQIGRPWARGLMNHVLRRCAEAPASEPSTLEARWDHPEWLIDLVREDYPNDWQTILTASLSRAPMTLRVNLRRIERRSYLESLSALGVSAHAGMTPQSLVLDTPISASRLPGFDNGSISVQDEGAQWAAALLEPRDGDRILDACAAPGGKAMHILECAPKADLLALDVDAQRCGLMRAECHRHGHDPAHVVHGDATDLSWWDGNPFDRILIDAPCTGSGTLRRHPDIKLLKHASDLHQYQANQRKLVANLWRILAAGGRMLYCTCSVLSIENERVIGEFVAKTVDACSQPIVVDWGVATQHGRQLLPSIDGPDGFYYAILEKL